MSVIGDDVLIDEGYNRRKKRGKRMRWRCKTAKNFTDLTFIRSRHSQLE